MHFLHILYNNELMMVSQTFLYYACNIIFWVFSFFKLERWLTLKSQAQNIKNILSSRIEEASWKTGSRTLLWRWWAFSPPGQSLVLSLASRFLVSHTVGLKKFWKKVPFRPVIYCLLQRLKTTVSFFKKTSKFQKRSPEWTCV